MSTFDVVVGAVIGAIVVVASIYGAGYVITKR
jgi:hypothetical protein